MKIHLLGASGSGVTTLGEQLAAELGVPYFDSDAYFWEASDPPFQLRRPAARRQAMLQADLISCKSWILGGSIISWGDEWLSAFDLAVFLWIPSALRLERLAEREYTRFGEVIHQDAARQAQFQEFLSWAAGYDDNTARGRTLAAHEAWLAKLTCPVLKIRGDYSIAERSQLVRAELARLPDQRSGQLS